MKKVSVFIIVLLVGVVSFYGCNKTGDPGNDSTDVPNADLVIKDSLGQQQVSLKIKPKVGDIFKYKLHIEQNGTESSSMNNNNEIRNNQTMDMFFINEVTEINDAGIITMKVRYDSIMVNIGASDKDTSYSLIYNSNVKDTVYKKSDFITFNSLIGNEFKIRVSPLGEVSTIYDLEKIQNQIYKEYGDTLKFEDKELVKKSLEEQLKELIQTQYQIFPEKNIFKDSVWSSVQQSILGSFPIENILKYSVNSIEVKEGSYIIGLTALLEFKVLENSIKDKTNGINYKLDEATGGGSGKIEFNLSKGCIIKKETEKKLSSKIIASLQGQSAKISKTDNIKLTLELIQ